MSGAKQQFSLGTVNPATTSGTELAAWLSEFGAAVQQTNIGPSEPSYTAEGTLWVNNATANQATLYYTPAHGTSIPLANINYQTNEAFPVTNGLAATNGNAAYTFEAAYAGNHYEVVPLGQADSLYVNNGQNAGNVFVSSANPLNLTAAQSGMTIMTNAAGQTVNLPAVQFGVNYRIFGTVDGRTILSSANGGTMFTPGGSVSVTSLPIQGNPTWGGGWDVICDGVNWRVVPFDAPSIAPNIIDTNRAVSLGQVQSMVAGATQSGASPLFSGGSAAGDNNTVSATCSFTTNGTGILFAIGSMNLSGSGGVSNAGTLTINVAGTQVNSASYSTNGGMTQAIAVSIASGQAASATMTGAYEYGFQVNVLLIFIPNLT